MLCGNIVVNGFCGAVAAGSLKAPIVASKALEVASEPSPYFHLLFFALADDLSSPTHMTLCHRHWMFFDVRENDLFLECGLTVEGRTGDGMK